MNIIENSVNNEVGYLEIYAGPMCSGKTTQLLELYKQFKFCGIPTLVINHADDMIRYPTAQLTSHDNKTIPCVMVNTLSEINDIANENKGNYYEDFMNASAILINEGQFFQDVVEWVTIAVEKYNKHVYICGLDGDFQRKKFGDWLEGLIPLCDNYTKFHSYCMECKKKKAIFTHRLINDKTQKIIGTDCYVPLCRLCYKKLNSAII
jgi:thymidine kinase